MSHPLFRIPVITGTIARRMLLNFRVDAGILRQILPAPFRPKLIQGAGMAGVCLIRLEHLRPLHIPAARLMRGIKHEWHGRQPLCAKSTGGAK